MSTEEFAFRNSPACLKNAFKAEAASTLENVLKYLPQSIDKCDPEAQTFYLRNLSQYMDLKYPITKAQRRDLAELLCRLLYEGNLDLRQGRSVLLVLYDLIKRKNVPGLVMQWRPLFELTKRKHFCLKGTQPVDSPAREEDHQRAVIKLVSKARHYFPATATEEILAELVPLLNPFDKVCARAQSLLCIFLPTNDSEQCAKWIPLAMQQLQEYQNCPSQMRWWLRLLSKAAKCSVGTYDWTPLLPKLFDVFMQAMNLRVGKSQCPILPDERLAAGIEFTPPLKEMSAGGAAEFAKLLAYTIHTQAAEDATIDFLTSLSFYFYPDNTGTWTAYLGGFLSYFALYYSTRYWKEKRGEMTPPEGARLVKSERIIDTLIPILRWSIYCKSPHLSWYAAMAAYNFSEVFPKKIMEFALPEMEGMTALTQSHKRNIAATLLLSLTQTLCNSQLYPEGALHLGRLLNAALEGIDPSLTRQTRLTFIVLQKVFSQVPFIDGRNTPRDEADEEKFPYDDQARSLTLNFEKFSKDFLKRIIPVLMVQRGADALFTSALQRGISAFWWACSDAIFESCVPIIVDVAVNPESFEPATHLGMLVVTCARRDLTGQVFLPKILPKIFAKMLEPDASSKLGFKLVGTKQALLYFMTILQYTIHAALGHVGPYLEKIRIICTLATRHDEAVVKSLGQGVISSLFKTVSLIRPAESRPFSSKIWKEQGWKSWQNWGQYYNQEMQGLKRWEFPDLHLDWWSASPELMKQLQSFINLLLEDPITLLVAASEAGSKYDVDEVERSIKLVANIAAGALSLIGDFAGDEIKYDCREKDISPSDIPLVLPRHYKSFQPDLQITVDGATSTFRSGSASLLTRVIRRFSAEPPTAMETDAMETDAPKEPEAAAKAENGKEEEKGKGGEVGASRILKAAADACKALLNKFGEEWGIIQAQREGTDKSLRLQQELLTGHKCAVRSLLVQKTFILNMKRVYYSHIRPRYTTVSKELLEAVQGLCMSNYKKVRESAVKVVVAKRLLRYLTPTSADHCLEVVSEVLRDPSSCKEAILGALSVLNEKGFATLVINRDYDVQAKVMQCIMDCGSSTGKDFSHTDVQDMVHDVFMNFLDLQFQMQLTVPAPGDKSRRDAILARNKAMLSQLDSFQAQLIAPADKKRHWRYQLMSAAAIYASSRADTLPNQGVINYFLQGLTSDERTFRQVSITNITMLLGTFVKAPCPPSGRDSNVVGWHPDAKKDSILCNAAAAECQLQPEQFAMMEQFLISNAKEVVQAVKDDHTLDEGDTEKVSDLHATEAAIRRIEAGVADKGELISMSVALIEDWPYDGWGLLSRGFLPKHARFFREIGRALHSDKAVDAYVAQFEALAAKLTEREDQCTAAEMFAGLVRALKYWSPELQAKFQKLLRPILEKVLTKCSQECIEFWCDALRFALYNTDPESSRWLTEWFVANSIRRDSDSPDKLVRSLRFGCEVLLGHSWRGQLEVGQILKQLAEDDHTFLAHRYHQVREELVKCLFFIFRSKRTKWVGPDSPPYDIAHSGDVMELVQALVAKEKVLRAAAKGAGADNDDEKESPENKANTQHKNLVETLCMMVSTCCGSGNAVFYSAVMVQILPIVLRARRHSDKSLKQYSELASTLLAWMDYKQSEMPLVLGKLEELIAEDNWHYREAVPKFLAIFVPRNVYKLGDEELKRISRILLPLFQDPQQEVRELAATAFVPFIMRTKRRHMIDKYLANFRKLAKKKCPKTKPDGMTQEKYDLKLRKRHAGVLGLCACVRTACYSVPDWMPETLLYLSSHAQDRMIISTGVKKTFAEFKRTHKDEWEEGAKHKSRFTSDQQAAIEDMTGGQSHYC